MPSAKSFAQPVRRKRVRSRFAPVGFALTAAWPTYATDCGRGCQADAAVKPFRTSDPGGEDLAVSAAFLPRFV